MAKTTAPLLSFGASGAIAQTQVYSRWRGVEYARRYVIPANPRTTAQTEIRNIFRLLQTLWLLGGGLLQAPWDLQATGQSYLGRNHWTGENVRPLRGNDSLANLQGSPGAKGGLPAESINVTSTPNPGELSVAFQTPEPPTSWQLQSVIAVGFTDQSPTLPWTGVTNAGQDETTMSEVLLTGFMSTTPVVVSGWPRWMKPNGTQAYGPSLTQTATPS